MPTPNASPSCTPSSLSLINFPRQVACMWGKTISSLVWSLLLAIMGWWWKIYIKGMWARLHTVDWVFLHKLREAMIYLSEEPNTSVRVKEDAAGGNTGPAVRRMVADSTHPNSVPSGTSKAWSKATQRAPIHVRWCQTASHQRSNNLMWALKSGRRG